MKLADRHGRPVSQVLSEYPGWELNYWAAWMAREPSDGRRVEFAVAHLHSTTIGINSKKGHKVPKAQDLVIPDYWAEQAEIEHQKAAQQDAHEITRMLMRSGVHVDVNRNEDEYL